MLLGLKFECYLSQRRSFRKEDSVAQTKAVAFAFTRRHLVIACSVKCAWKDFTHFYFSRSSVLREKKLRGQRTCGRGE